MNAAGLRILLVDNDSEHCEVISRLFRQRGWEVCTASDAPQGFQVAQSFRPGVLVANWRLPGDITGGVLATLLRRIFPTIRIVFFTSFAENDLHPLLHHLGDCKLVQQPYTPLELLEIVERMLPDAGCPNPSSPLTPIAG